MTRKIFFVGFAAGIVGLALACSNSDEGSSSGGNNNGNSSGASGTSGGQSSGSSSSKFKNCDITGGTTCTEAELKPYSDCVLEKCDTSYKQCYGDDYRNGNFSGPCGTWMACVQKCDCTDTACVLACKLDEACKTCSEDAQVETCGESCIEPECSKQGTPKPDGGNNPNATCADLQGCCDGMPAGEQKDGCNSVAQGGDDANCGTAYNAMKSAGLCN